MSQYLKSMKVSSPGDDFVSLLANLQARPWSPLLNQFVAPNAIMAHSIHQRVHLGFFLASEPTGKALLCLVWAT